LSTCAASGDFLQALLGARVVTFSELLPETTIRAAGTATLRG